MRKERNVSSYETAAAPALLDIATFIGFRRFIDASAIDLQQVYYCWNWPDLTAGRFFDTVQLVDKCNIDDRVLLIVFVM